ncbi:MAG: molybdopterin cofactor-binding domain-containing protein [Thermodesulfobacteriota bacterium]
MNRPDYRILGKRVPRPDALLKVTGQAKYTTDLAPPGLLVGKILRSTRHHARLVHLDPAPALKVPGVRAVITAADLPPVVYGFGDRRADMTVFATDRVRYKGDEIAAVAAEDEETAQEALARIVVEYEDLPAVFDPEEAVREGAPRLHDDAPDNIGVRLRIDKGDMDRALAEADLVREDRFDTQRVHQCYAEPYACVAEWDASGRITLHTGTMNASGLRIMLGRVLKVPVGRIRVVQSHTGGSFGSKVVLNSMFPAAAVLSRLTGRPVRMVYTREEEYFASRPRYSGRYYVRTAVRKDGTILGRELNFFYDAGAYCDMAAAMIIVCSHRNDSVYRLPSIRTDAKLVYTNKSPVGAYRGYGNPQNTFAFDSQLDLIAEDLGLDPAELRLRNATRSGDVTVHGWRITSCGLTEAIERNVKASGWKEKRGRRRHLHRGIGMACTIHEVDDRHSDGFAGSNAEIEILEDGQVVIYSGEGEYGQGRDTTFCQLAAEVLGVDLASVRILLPDTDVTPYALGPWGSRVTYSGGLAVTRAAEEVRRLLLAEAAEMLEANAEDLTIREGRVFAQGLPRALATVAEVAHFAHFRKKGRRLHATGQDEPATTKMDPTRQSNPCSTYSFACQTVEVEVDEGTGEIKVLKVWAANDGGHILNPVGAEGQIEGQVLQGLGFAKTEEMVYRQGHLLNPDFMTSGTPGPFDAPELDIYFTRTYDPTGPFGAKGVAEVAAPPTAAALANAVYDAIGVRITKLPLSPENVLAAIEAARAKGAVRPRTSDK